MAALAASRVVKISLVPRVRAAHFGAAKPSALNGALNRHLWGADVIGGEVR